MAHRVYCGAIASLALGLFACAAMPGKTSPTIQEIMVRTVNPAAGVLWGAVGLESTVSGTVELAPRNDADWEKIRRGVTALIEAAGDLTVPGRRVAAKGAILADASTPGNLLPGDIQSGIDSDFSGFVERAWSLRDAGRFALSAIDERNVEKLAEAGEIVNSACGACHDAYWYPNSIQPVQ